MQNVQNGAWHILWIISQPQEHCPQLLHRGSWGHVSSFLHLPALGKGCTFLQILIFSQTNHVRVFMY